MLAETRVVNQASSLARRGFFMASLTLTEGKPLLARLLRSLVL